MLKTGLFHDEANLKVLPDPEGLAILIETINSYKTFLMKTLATTGGCLVTFVIWMMFLFSSKFRLDYEVVFLCLDLS